MKIETDISNDFFHCFDEARGVAQHKAKILQTKSARPLSYLQGKIVTVCILLLMSAVLLFLGCINIRFITASWLIIILAIIYLLHALATIIVIHNIRKKQNFKNSIIIDKNGITDESYYGIKMIFSWDKIKGFIVGKYTVTILTDTPIYFYFNISKKDEILKAIEKYEPRDKKLSK